MTALIDDTPAGGGGGADGAKATPGQIIDGLAQLHLEDRIERLKFAEACRSGSSLLRTALKSPSALGRRRAMDMVADHLDEYAKLLGDDEGGKLWVEILKDMDAGGFGFSERTRALLADEEPG